MSARYEWVSAPTVPIDVVKPGAEFGEQSTETSAIVLGDPWAGSMVIEGDRDQLLDFTQTLVSMVERLAQ